MITVLQYSDQIFDISEISKMPTNPDEPYYCSQQINIPPSLPDILKQFTKAAIRTQPKDVLAWSAA